VACGSRVDEDVIVRVYEMAGEIEAEERSLGEASEAAMLGAKGVVEKVLERLQTGG
jgi:exosome complex component RRP4